MSDLPARREEALYKTLERWKPMINALLPAHVSTAHYLSIIDRAVRSDSNLLRCDLDTLAGAALEASVLGLEPNDIRNQCWIIPYKGRATFQLGYGGVMELTRRAAPGVMFTGHPVYPNDTFDLDYGRTPPLVHRPAFTVGRERGGPARLWYVLVTWPDKTQQVHALDTEAVEAHRKASKQPDGLMWTGHYDAAALKTVVHDMRRWLPQSPEVGKGWAVDDRVIRLNTEAKTPALVVEPEDIPFDALTAGGGPEGGAPVSMPAADAPPPEPDAAA